MLPVWSALALRSKGNKSQINLISEVSDAAMDSDHVDQFANASSLTTTSTEQSLCQRTKAWLNFVFAFCLCYQEMKNQKNHLILSPVHPDISSGLHHQEGKRDQEIPFQM